ncbi:MAG: GNAT family N-acetyltransferase [Chitinophagales bacterium]|nr:GNAT family N-acetyltransferase [Chitinophagales bacterium]
MDFILRGWLEGDAESLAKHANNFKIAKNLRNVFPHPYSIEDAHAYIARSQNKPTNKFAIVIEGEACGGAGIFQQDDVYCKNAELGYWLSEQFWGNGVMSKVVKQMVQYGFKTFDVTRIFAVPYGTNLASQRVLEKAGFTLEAILEKTIFKNGEFEDEHIYAIRKT